MVPPNVARRVCALPPRGDSSASARQGPEMKAECTTRISDQVCRCSALSCRKPRSRSSSASCRMMTRHGRPWRRCRLFLFLCTGLQRSYQSSRTPAPTRTRGTGGGPPRHGPVNSLTTSLSPTPTMRSEAPPTVAAPNPGDANITPRLA
jgi:hypothetical protein